MSKKEKFPRELHQFSLCPRYAMQLLPWNMLIRMLGDGDLDLESQAQLKQTMMDHGMRKVEFDEPISISAGNTHFTVFSEKPVVRVGDTYLEIPIASRYCIGVTPPEATGNSIRWRFIERIDMSREPSQESGRHILSGEINYDKHTHWYTQRAVKIDEAGDVRALKFQRTIGEYFEFIEVADTFISVSVGRYFNRDRKPPYSFEGMRRSSLSLLVESDSFKLLVNNEAQAAARENLVEEPFQFDVDVKGSVFAGKGNVLQLTGDQIILQGDETFWKVPASPVDFAQNVDGWDFSDTRSIAVTAAAVFSQLESRIQVDGNSVEII